MSEAEYNNKVAEATLAYLHHLITYDEWHDYMTKLIERRQNNEIQ